MEKPSRKRYYLEYNSFVFMKRNSECFRRNIARCLVLLFIACSTSLLYAQSALPIPTLLSGTTFNLNIINGHQSFYPGSSTPTYGINDSFLGPTLLLQKGDFVNINVRNSLVGTGNSTTMHWHGLHVPARYDGGPDQVINQGSTWTASFKVLNKAATFWYHPHGLNKTDLHVSKGLAGFIIVRDSAEALINLPRTYGVDDFPIVVQSKSFDVLHQIAIATEMDTAIMLNGAINPYLNVPSQVIRLRLLNGSSMRSYLFGLSDTLSFKMIGGDGGLLDTALTLNRVRLSPGERAEILVDLQGMSGRTIYLKAFNSELPDGIYGAAHVTGSLGGSIPGYSFNPLNGADFNLLEMRIGTMTASPVTSTPTALLPQDTWPAVDTSRIFLLESDSLGSPEGQVEGPFNINGLHFSMDSINVITFLNNTEKWKIINNTGIAHPFHIHNVHFTVLNVNGGAVPITERGRKDVVLVMPGEYVEFITRFEDYADNHVPYMYHCHLLHHEDDGMMGSFLVIDTSALAIEHISTTEDLMLYPNPITGGVQELHISATRAGVWKLMDLQGKIIVAKDIAAGEERILLDCIPSSGIYLWQFQQNNGSLLGRGKLAVW
jgi:blue copper oxidase